MAAYNPCNFDLSQFMNDLFQQPDLSGQFQFLGNHLQVANTYASAMEQELAQCHLSKRRQLRTIENSSPDNVPWLPRMVDYKLGNLQNSPRRSNTHTKYGGIESVRKLSLNQ
jgi:hypothetical protein